MNGFTRYRSRRRRTRRRWSILAGIYVIGLSIVMGVLAERRWGWLPVKARTRENVLDGPVPRGPDGLSLGPTPTHWAQAPGARGWDGAGAQSGYFLEPGGVTKPAPALGPANAEAAALDLGSGLGMGLGEFKIQVPDFKKVGKR